MNDRRIGKIVFFLFALGGVFFLMSAWFLPTEGKKTTLQTETGLNRLSCKSDIDRLDERDALMMKGDTYFGESKSYSIRCAEYAYWRSLDASSTPHIRVWYELGRIDFLTGQYQSALAKFDNQVTLFGDELPNVYYMIGLANGYKARQTGNEEDWKRAEEGFLSYLKFFPTSPWGRTDLAWVYFSEGKYDEMKPIIEEGLTHHPHHPWLLNMYGLALLNTGEKIASRAYFDDALRESNNLTPNEWGKSYPGNDPSSWSEGLVEMKKAIAHNRELAYREDKVLQTK